MKPILLLSLLLFPLVAGAESDLLAPGAQIRKLAGGFLFTEGPACDREGNVYFTDQPNDCILKWTVDDTLVPVLQPSGRANGLCFDQQGNLWICADEHHELRRREATGKIETVVSAYQGQLLNGPNDLWIRPDGGVYFTDPFYHRSYWPRTEKEQETESVYFLSFDRQRLVQVASDLKRPNGIIGTPDGKFLYVSDLGANLTYRYQIEKDGSLSAKSLFCALGSDGMTIDDQGNIYLTGNGVTVFNPAGQKIEQINPPEPGWVGNVCFGGKDRRTLFITASKNLYALQMKVAGVGSQ